MGNELTSIQFHRDWYESLKELDEQERLAAYEAVFEYAFGSIEPEDKLIRIATKLIFSEIDSEKEIKEQELLAQAQKAEYLSRVRSEAGKRGAEVTNRQKSAFAGKSQQTSANSANVGKSQQKETENKEKENFPPHPLYKETENKEKEKESANSNEFVLNQRFNEKLSTNACVRACEDDENFSLSEKPDGLNSISYDFILMFWNERMQGKTIPRLQKLTESRRKNINARLREGFSFDDIKQAIVNASQSDFLNGKNGKGWVADFNWVFRPTNFPKVLEGNYSNKPQTINAYGTSTTGSGYITSAERHELERREREREAYELMRRLSENDGGQPLPPLEQQGSIYG